TACAHVYVDVAGFRCGREKEFGPVLLHPSAARRRMVARIVRAMLEPGAGEGCSETDQVQLSHGDLNVDHVLGRQAWYGCGTDVVDAKREIAQAVSQDLSKRLELPRPARHGSHDLDRLHGASVPTYR